MVIDFVYLGTQTFQIFHQANSLAANQITTLTGAGFEISYGPCAGTLRYNANTTKWILTDWYTMSTPGGVVQEKSGFLLNATWGTTAQTTYSTFGNQTWPVTFNKRYAGTLLMAEVSVSGWMTGAAGVAYVGFSNAHPTAPTVNQTIAQFFFNTLAVHSCWSGFQTWSGIGASALPCSFWIKVGSASCTVTSDANDVLCWKIREVWP